MILVVETKEGRFKHHFPVSSYQSAMRLIYRDKRIHVRLCYRNVKPWERERPSCEFTSEAIEIRNSAGLAREEWPYSRAIILRHEQGGELTLATSIPGPAPESDAYHPEFLFTDKGPVPGRVFTLLKYGRELVRLPGPDLPAPRGTTAEGRSSPPASGSAAARKPPADPAGRGSDPAPARARPSVPA